MSPQEVEDCYDLIEWAGAQDWSNGKVGMLGVSYLAWTQWKVAAACPPHLAAISPGRSDDFIVSSPFMEVARRRALAPPGRTASVALQRG
jgi:putative CocE/NonD family hydrolase